LSEGFGTLVAKALNEAGIVTNRNTVPRDANPFYPSGLRIGTPAVTTRGMKEAEMEKIAGWIVEVVEEVKAFKLPSEKPERAEYLNGVTTRRFGHVERNVEQKSN
jgi:glycine hydroxymethyltransferase